MANSYIKILKEANGDITYPQTLASAVHTNNGSDVETEMGKYVTAEEIISTSAITPVVSTAMLQDEAVTTTKVADSAITTEKLDWSTFPCYTKVASFSSTTLVSVQLMDATTIEIPGKYLIIGDMGGHPNGYDYRIINIVINGSRKNSAQCYQNQRYHLSTNGIFNLNTGDTVTVGMYSNGNNFYAIDGTYSIVRVA